MDVYEAVARNSSDVDGHRLYDIYLMLDGKPHGKPVVKTVSYATAMRVAQALCEWQPQLGERTS
jgi:hypothetical protein